MQQAHSQISVEEAVQRQERVDYRRNCGRLKRRSM